MGRVAVPSCCFGACVGRRGCLSHVAFMGLLGGRFGPFWDPLGLSGAPSGPSWGILEAFGRLGALLGASWGPLGNLLGGPGALLGPS